MPRYYINILPWLRPYVTKIAPMGEDWARQLFNDISDRGKTLLIVELPPSARGSRIGLCGERFFCEGGIDRERPDSLFIHHVETAESRLPRQIPKAIQGEFHLLTSQNEKPPAFDSIQALLEPEVQLQ